MVFRNEKGAGSPPAQTNSGIFSEDKQSLFLNIHVNSVLRKSLIKTNTVKGTFFISRLNKT